MASNDDEAIDIDLLLDRLVSASNSEDAEQALDQILNALPRISIPEDANEVWTALISIFHDGSLGDTLQVPDGRTTAGRILLQLLQSPSTSSTVANILLPLHLLESCIDVACSNDGTALYPRMLALQILQKVSSSSNNVQSQWLAAPNGLHRIADLLRDDATTELQTETLTLARILAQWSAVAKLWMFAEMGDVVVHTALQQGGLTGGSVTVYECIDLLRTLVSHDKALADLVVAESPVVVPGLCRLLDLRAAKAFRYPDQQKRQVAEQEDLDALLASSSTTTTKKAGADMTPFLLESEEKIILCVLSILEIVLENESLKETVWQQHKALGTFIWDMALLVRPPPGQPAVCGVPSIDVRVAALRTAARYFHSASRPGWEDRLLGAICTSCGEEDPRLSHGALYLLRRTCTDAVANEILLQGLAPAMDGDQQQQASVVHKLLNTILEQLGTEEQRPVLVVGALFALSVFLKDEARRSILFKISMAENGKDSKLLQTMFAYLERATEETEQKLDPYVTWHVWRFLAVWMQDAPVVVQAVLTSPQQPLLTTCPHPVARLCLGITALHGGDENLCGGWSRSSLLQSAQPWSKWTTSLESLKEPNNYLGKYVHSEDEGIVWKDWVTPVVLEVRQALVQEMTSAAEENDEDGLGRLVKEQKDEIESLRTSLKEAQHRVDAQGRCN